MADTQLRIEIVDISDSQCVGRVYGAKSIMLIETPPQVWHGDALSIIGQLFATFPVDVLYGDLHNMPVRKYPGVIKILDQK